MININFWPERSFNLTAGLIAEMNGSRDMARIFHVEALPGQHIALQAQGHRDARKLKPVTVL